MRILASSDGNLTTMSSNRSLDDAQLLAQCRRLIEEKLGWGDSRQWSTEDFEQLSERILAETGVNLSVSTLKRLWGKVHYGSSPQLATLNALARFVNQENWRAFQFRQQVTSQPQPPSEPEPLPSVAPIGLFRPRRISSGTIWSIGMVTGLGVALLLAFSLRVKQSNLVRPSDYSFSSRPLAAGLPNSVVFDYEASRAQTDCVFIQQSWDIKRRFKVSKQGRQATSLYYYPGFFQAKLVVDNQVVKEHPLLIKTLGWLPLAEQESVPVYFTPRESIRQGQLGLAVELLEARHIPLQPVVPWVSYYNVGNFTPLSSTDFTLETELKNTYPTGSAACQHSQVIILCTNNIFVIPLTIRGCSAGINLYLAGKTLEGSHADLSALGVDFTDGVRLRLEVKNKQVAILINGNPALQSVYDQEAGPVVGLCYRFQGTGSVNYVHLFDRQGKKVFAEEF